MSYQAYEGDGLVFGVLPYNGAFFTTRAGIVLVDVGCSRATGQAMRQMVKDARLPIALIVLTHYHWDHSANLDRYKDLRCVPIVLGNDSPLLQNGLKHPPESSLFIAKERETVSVGGLEVELLPTPGHSDRGDDLCVWLPRQRILFCGDMVQPQGEMYSHCTGFSPVSNHAFGGSVLSSLQALLALPMETLVTGHSTVLHGERAQRWISVTAQVLKREWELAQKLVREHPRASTKTISRWIFDTLAWERSYSPAAARKRKRNGHFKSYDYPGIAWFVEEAKKEAAAKRCGRRGHADFP
ncbi:MAG: MBL fold metallo-hydrolase [Armatimonadetes bacterium]|nr:MBL fold metallo-hydrolase [Armatimonadota bacterium]